MNSSISIFYLHYIINFIDDEYKICHSLNETFCFNSILGINPDLYCKVQGDTLQFICEKNHCFVRFWKNLNPNRIKEKLWLKPYIIDNYNKIFDNRSNFSEKCLNDKIYEFNRLKTFFVREISIQMSRKLFEKITKDSYFCEKEYTIEDIFYICYSYGFSFLDNQVAILKNFLFLIIEDKFDLDEINKMFLKKFFTRNQNSVYYNKLIDEIAKNSEFDLQSKIDQLIFEHYQIIKSDSFLNEIFQWRTKLSNMFTLIQQTFYFNVLTNDEKSIGKIYNDVNSKYIFNISLIDIGKIISILSNDCILSIKSFTNNTNMLFSEILHLKQEINIYIDITEFYIKLYEFEEEKLINEGINMQNFFLFLSTNTTKPIIVIITKNEILVKYNEVSNIFQIARLKNGKQFIMNESFLLSEKIFMARVYSHSDLLKKFALVILEEFMTQHTEKIGNILFHRDGIPKLIQKDTFCDIYYHHTESSSNFWQYEHTNDLDRTFVLSGMHDKETRLIGLECCHQKYTNFCFIGGVFDDEFSLFEIKSTSNESHSEFISDFVVKMSDLFQLNRSNSSSSSNGNENYDSIDFSSKTDQILVYHMDLGTEVINKEEFFFSLPQQSKFNIHQSLSHNYAYSIVQNSIIQIEKINHHILSENGAEKSLNLSSDTILLPQINSRNCVHCIEIIQSNFHIILSRFIEIKSINSEKSAIKKNSESFGLTLKIIHCEMKFLTDNFSLFDHIRIENCKLPSFLHLDYSGINQKNYYISIENIYNVISIQIFDFMNMQNFECKNFFGIAHRCNFFSLISQNCHVKIVKKIPSKYIFIPLFRIIMISVENNIIFKDHPLIPTNIAMNTDLSSIYTQIMPQLAYNKPTCKLEITNCILPPHLCIKGIFNSITFGKNSSYLVVDSFFHQLQIYDHNGEFEIKNIISKAISKQSTGNNLFMNKIKFVILNLKIECLQNITVDYLKIFNCTIKNINNVKCKSIEIRNTTCSFQLTSTDQILQHVVGARINLIKNEEEYMTIQGNSEHMSD